MATRPPSQPEPPPHRWATLPECSEYTRDSVRTLRRRIANGEIRAYRFGKRGIRVDLNEVDSAFKPIPNGLAS